MLGSGIELEISAPSFPNMRTFFQVSEEAIGRTITINLIGFCLGSLLYGPISECYGRRKIMILGNSLLAISSIACVFTPTFKFLLFARFFQGIGAATSAVLTSAMIADSYNTKESTKLYGIMNSIFTIVMALSPTIGGIINFYIGWRGNYGAVAIVCISSLIVIIACMEETKQNLTTLSLRNIVFDYFKLLKDFKFICASLVPSISYGCYLGFITCAAFLYIEIFKFSVLKFVIHQGTITAAFAITSIFADRISDSMSNKNTVLLGINLSLISTVGMVISSFVFPLSANLITFFTSTFAVGSAIIYPIVFTLSLEIYPHLKGTASSAIMFLRYIMCALTVGIMCASYNGSSLPISICSLGAVMMAAIFIYYLIRSNFFEQPLNKG